jgi:carboxymethylenebutenolidase
MDVVSQEIEVPVGGEKMPCHIARPKSGGHYPALVVVMEAFGLNGQMKRITDRFAAEGFVAISPNLFFRMPNNVVGYDQLPAAIKLMTGITDEKVVTDMKAAIEHLKKQADVKPSIGVTGFCMGGRVSFLTACRNPDVKAVAPYYGGGMVNSMQPGVKPPIEYVETLKAPVLAFFGGKDAFIPIADVDKFRDALQKAAKSAEVVLYADADHGFMCDERASFHAAHSKEAFAKTIEFFKRNLT